MKCDGCELIGVCGCGWGLIDGWVVFGGLIGVGFCFGGVGGFVGFEMCLRLVLNVLLLRFLLLFGVF